MMRSLNLPGQLLKEREFVLYELERRTLWFVTLRYFVPPVLYFGAMAARALGVGFELGAVQAVALLIFAYNVGFGLWSHWLRRRGGWQGITVRRFTYWQVTLDYLAMFLLIHFTGGAASPFIFFFIFHVIFAAILLPPLPAYGFAGLAAGGMSAVAAAEYLGWLPHHPILWAGQGIDLAQKPFHMMVEMGFFTASVFMTAYSASAVMPVFHKRLQNLAELSEAILRLNHRLNTLYGLTQSLAAKSRFDRVLEIVCDLLSETLNIEAVSVKLVTEDGRKLRYAAAHGLPAELGPGREIEIERSPLNRRVLEGEPFVAGRLNEGELFQFGEPLAKAGFQSVLFTPLRAGDKVIGILGAYSRQAQRFSLDEADFLALASGLVGVALDNTLTFEAAERLARERSVFLTRMVHNLRSPLTAAQSMLNLFVGGPLSEGLAERHREHLEKIRRRVDAMLGLVGELMGLAEARRVADDADWSVVDLKRTARELAAAHRPAAAERGLTLELHADRPLPAVRGRARLLESALDNLIANAVKYTPRGGVVEVSLDTDEQGQAVIEVADTGIGIPEEAQPRLFTEFFRAANARDYTDLGTGLGLVFVKETVEGHGGRVQLTSAVGRGTRVTVVLPAAPPEAVGLALAADGGEG